MDFLKSYELSKRDPTNIFQNEIKQVIKNCTIFNQNENLIVMNPQPPKLYSLLK